LALQRVGYLGMFWSQALLPDCQRLPFGKCWKARLLPSNIQPNVSNPDLSGCSGWWTKRPALNFKVGEEEDGTERRRCSFSMIGLKPSLAQDGLGPRGESFGLLRAVHRPQQRRIALQSVGYLGMFWSQALLPDCQRPLEERLRFGVFPLMVVQNRQVVQTCGHVRVLRTETFLADRQR